MGIHKMPLVAGLLLRVAGSAHESPVRKCLCGTAIVVGPHLPLFQGSHRASQSVGTRRDHEGRFSWPIPFLAVREAVCPPKATHLLASRELM